MKITPEIVLQAYKDSGLKPLRANYRTLDGQACAIGVLAGLEPNAAEHQFHVAVCKKFDVKTDYTYGLMNGFDNGSECDVQCDTCERRHEGYEDGKKIAEAVFGAMKSGTDNTTGI